MYRALIVIICLIVYGSLYPFTGWTIPHTPLFSFLNHWPPLLERADVIQNVLAYIPLGFFISAALEEKKNNFKIILFTACAGGILSLAMEGTQQFLPTRVSSLSDLTFNLVGTCFGAAAGLFISDTNRQSLNFYDLRQRYFFPGTLADQGILSLCIWILVQTSPWVPTFDISQLRRGASNLYQTAMHPEKIVAPQVVIYFFSFLALYLIWLTVIRPQRGNNFKFIALCSGSLLIKIMIYGRQLSLEACLGLVSMMLFVPALANQKNKYIISMLGIASIGIELTLQELRIGEGMLLRPINWVPFAGQLQSLSGFQSILENFWPGFGLAYFTRLFSRYTDGLINIILGACCLVLFLAILVWNKQFIFGRSADITQIIICLLGWIFGWQNFFKQDQKNFKV